MLTSKIFVLLLIASIAIVGVISLWLNSRRYRRIRFTSRSMIDLQELFSERFERYGVQQSTFLVAWEAVAQAFELDPRQLRPTDSFDDDLGRLDSWNSGEGVLRLEDRLKERGLLEKRNLRIDTVEDFVLYYCGAEKTSEHKRESAES